MDHWHGVELDQRRTAAAVAIGEAGDMGRNLVIGDAEVVMDVPLGSSPRPKSLFVQTDSRRVLAAKRIYLCLCGAIDRTICAAP